MTGGPKKFLIEIFPEGCRGWCETTAKVGSSVVNPARSQDPFVQLQCCHGGDNLGRGPQWHELLRVQRVDLETWRHSIGLGRIVQWFSEWKLHITENTFIKANMLDLLAIQ
jgi:hypothetical protein